LKDNLSEIGGWSGSVADPTWTSLKDLYDKAGTAGDTTGASAMIKSFSDEFGAISTTTQTVSSTLSTTMQMVNADYQQYLGIFNSLMQALLQLNGDTVKMQVV
jgi:hypothetical protein